MCNQHRRRANSDSKTHIFGTPLGTNVGKNALRDSIGKSIEQINTSNIRWLFKRELAVSILNGIVLSLLVGITTYAWFQDITIALLISFALVINLISSVIAGILVPLVLRKLKQDPAIGGSVVVTTVTDVVGFLSFLGLATIYLI